MSFRNFRTFQSLQCNKVKIDRCSTVQLFYHTYPCKVFFLFILLETKLMKFKWVACMQNIQSSLIYLMFLHPLQTQWTKKWRSDVIARQQCSRCTHSQTSEHLQSASETCNYHTPNLKWNRSVIFEFQNHFQKWFHSFNYWIL